jgi:hypothetical protein
MSRFKNASPIRLAAALLIAFALSLASAQAAPPPLDRLHPLLTGAEADAVLVQRQAAYAHFITRYAVALSFGLATGGIVMYKVFGDGVSAIFGSWLGAVLTDWLFLDKEADHILVMPR